MLRRSILIASLLIILGVITAGTNRHGLAQALPLICSGETFTDVCPNDYFYTPVLALNQAGIVSGYNTSPPCETPSHVPCFLPANNITRGQTSKIISLAAGFNDPVSEQSFEDVPVDSTFYDYIERLSAGGSINGYACGGPGEPCGAGNKPYFRPNANLTRGQLSKIASESFGFEDIATTQTFEDVPSASTFYDQIERLAMRDIINGYPCGGPGEPCGSDNKPYFRSGNQVTRAQTAKIVYLSMSQMPPTATQTATPEATGTIATNTPTNTPTGVPPTSTPTCCTDMTGSASASCEPGWYVLTYTINNSCMITRTANMALIFEVSPNIGGPWQPYSVADYIGLSIPPGSITHTESVYLGPLPPGNNYWRYTQHYSGTDCRWSLTIQSNPQAACIVNTPTAVATTTPTSTHTSTPIPSPTCCTSVTGTISAFCGDVVYAVTYTIYNSCPTTLTANIASYFEVSPNSTGPWQPLYIGDCFSCPVPPGTHEYTETVFAQQLPAGNNYWRYSKGYYGDTCTWQLLLVTDPQPACIAPTPSPSPQRR